MKYWTDRSVVFVAGLLAACASPDPTFYALQTIPGSSVALARTVVEVRRPGLAGYLDRSDIVLKNAEYRLKVDSQLRWGEPLGDMIGRVVTEDLSQRLSGTTVFSDAGAISADADFRVEVNVERFDEDSGGSVVLAAEIAVERGRTHHPVAARHLTVSALPAGPGAGALVAAMSGLLAQLSDDVAHDIQHGAMTPAID
jgi:uncharacterized lipoprotein YmbA